ncbi:MAG: peptidoglycan DD-metalloendopeptidase family protein [Pseudomonadales bacterium]|nr:peptidoglycan DD-metalloendopeptidase family protein [Pseudomonadales bacterium]
MAERTADHTKNISAFPRGHLLIIAVAIITCLLLIVLSGKNEAAVQSIATMETKAPHDTHHQDSKKTENHITEVELAAIRKPTTSLAIPTGFNEQESLNKTSAPANNSIETVITVKNGDNLSSIFHKAGLNDKWLYKVIHTTKEAEKLTRIYPGETFTFVLSEAEDGKTLQKLTHNKNRLEYAEVENTGETFKFRQITLTPDVLYNFSQGYINNSLFVSALEAGLSENLTMELANIFGWDVDFIQDIREGDHFAVVYEEHYLNGEKIGNGDIVAATFTNQGRKFSAVRFQQKNGSSSYFTPDGKSMRKAFLRSPVDFARISSHFNLKRKHPILHTIRAHKGTDYAAGRGTPVRATGDGKVIHAGRKGGYGNTIILQHGQTYQTLYAHLDKFRRGIKAGTSVNQGDIIGYVGSTGLATGPHLHYEFYVNGEVRNPVTVRFPDAEPITPEEMKRFSANAAVQISRLENFLAANNTQVVMAD